MLQTKKINTYRTLSSAEMRKQERLLAKLLFRMPTLEIPLPKGKMTFSVAQSGFISYRNSPEFNSKFAKPSLPKNEAQAKKLAKEWMQKADEALAKVHLLKQVNFPPLFNQFEFVAANPVTSIENTFADYWSVTFQVFLQTGIKTQKKVPLQGNYMELMLGASGRIIGLEYNHLPIKKSQKSNLFNLLPESKEPATGTGAVLQTRNPNTGQAPPPTQEIQKLPPQELPQIVYNLNPDTGIITPYFLSTKGEIPACKEANRVRRVNSDREIKPFIHQAKSRQIQLFFAQGNESRSVFDKLIKKIFDLKVVASIEPIQPDSPYFDFTLIMKDTYTFDDLSSAQKSVLNFINTTDNIVTEGHSIMVEIHSINEGPWTDWFDKKRLYVNCILDFKALPEDFKLAMFFHFFQEQWIGIFPKSNPYKLRGVDYDSEEKYLNAHNYTIDTQLQIFEYKYYQYTQYLSSGTPNNDIWDFDFVNSKDEYINSVRCKRVEVNEKYRFEYKKYVKVKGIPENNYSKNYLFQKGKEERTLSQDEKYGIQYWKSYYQEPKMN